VRALATLLPEIGVVEGCPCFCNPYDKDKMCERCRKKRSAHKIQYKKVRVVTLPLNATEDRVAGGIDFSLAVKEGKRSVLPGLLADANRSILYVDEVNLLDDHIVDIILDAAASGENRIEREGISFKHPASFVLIRTMNPEEGELRPQLLDRFGLCVDVAGEPEMEKRVELIQRRESFDLDFKGFMNRFEKENHQVAEQIATAMESLAGVRCPKHLRTFISELCTKNMVAGHRADQTDDSEQSGETTSPEQIFEVGSTFAVKKIVSPRDRVSRRGSGRRSRTRVSLKQGRYIKSTPGDRNGDIALDATLRAAAPHQLARKKENGLAVVLKKEDIREKVREKRIGNFLLFTVDASGSMGARE
jgi:hypothetical protein